MLQFYAFSREHEKKKNKTAMSTDNSAKAFSAKNVPTVWAFGFTGNVAFSSHSEYLDDTLTPGGNDS